ncbi:hypothetical protein [Maridesulfovibrio sp.]|uniref:hypothetical protein n=1 Tax=Maridesulfovibrio sp. TaxID=2795000 RepID=UPI002AA837D1|nr:hypothetical protein [Maridesulfovibrio sp.]
MKQPMLPEVRESNYLHFLRQLRTVLRSRVYGIPDPIHRCPTFKDLVELGLVPEDKARKQAEKR